MALLHSFPMQCQRSEGGQKGAKAGADAPEPSEELPALPARHIRPGLVGLRDDGTHAGAGDDATLRSGA